MAQKIPTGIIDIYLGDYFSKSAVGCLDYKTPAGDDLKFEIRLCESLLADDPTCLEALQLLAQIYTQIGECQKGLEMDLRLSRLLPQDAVVHYNLACSHSLLGQLDEAFTAIYKSIELGYDEIPHMLSDPDLKNLREDHRFMEFQHYLELRLGQE